MTKAVCKMSLQIQQLDEPEQKVAEEYNIKGVHTVSLLNNWQ